MISLKMQPRDVSWALELLGLTTDVWAPLRAVKSCGAAEAALKRVQKTIHAAFRSRARALHPDQGGDEHDFQIVSELKGRVENLKLQRPARATPARPASNMPFDQRWSDMLRQQREREAARRAQRVVVVNMEDFFSEVFAATAQQPRAKQNAGSRPKQRTIFTDTAGASSNTTANPRTFFTTPDPHWNSSRSAIEDLMNAMRVAQGFPPKSGTGNK